MKTEERLFLLECAKAIEEHHTAAANVLEAFGVIADFGRLDRFIEAVNLDLSRPTLKSGKRRAMDAVLAAAKKLRGPSMPAAAPSPAKVAQTAAPEVAPAKALDPVVVVSAQMELPPPPPQSPWDKPDMRPQIKEALSSGAIRIVHDFGCPIPADPKTLRTLLVEQGESWNEDIRTWNFAMQRAAARKPGGDLWKSMPFFEDNFRVVKLVGPSGSTIKAPIVALVTETWEDADGRCSFVALIDEIKGDMKHPLVVPDLGPGRNSTDTISSTGHPGGDSQIPAGGRLYCRPFFAQEGSVIRTVGQKNRKPFLDTVRFYVFWESRIVEIRPETYKEICKIRGVKLQQQNPNKGARVESLGVSLPAGV